MSHEWIFVALAVVAEVTAALALRFSYGFSKLLPTVLALTAFGLAFYMVSIALTSLPISTVYPIWAGGGTVGVALLGVVALHERAGLWKALGVAMVVAGIAVLNMAPIDHGA